jgi:hypothetical protein
VYLHRYGRNFIVTEDFKPCMAEKKPKTIRLPKPEAERIEGLADQYEMSEADMYRRLIRAGLEAEPASHDDLDTEGEEFDTTLHAPGQRTQVAGGLVIAISVAVLVAVQLPEAAVAAVAAALGGAIGGSLR